MAGLHGSAESQTSRLPNVVVILADDLGSGDLSCYGSPNVATPNVDRLAEQGVRFTSFYANAPECSPTRTAFLTGRYQQRVGGLECAIGNGNCGRYDDAVRLAEQHDLGLPSSYSVLPSILEGYQTACIGKWHLGYEPKHWPDQHGFEYWVGPLGGGVDYFHHTEPSGSHVLYRQGQEYFSDQYMTHLITDESVRWIRQQDKENPFFLYAAYTAPHAPYQGPEDRRPEPKTSANWKVGGHDIYAAMVAELDRGVGEICLALEEQNLADNTIVIFFSDNGANYKGSNAPFWGNKSQLFEGGIRVPCVIRWPGRVDAGSVCDQPCLSMDLTASIATVAQQAGRFDGMDILAHVLEKRPDVSRDLFWRMRRGERTERAVRSGDLKYLLRDLGGGVVEEYLFNLEDDSAEQKNLLSQYPEQADRLRNLLSDWEHRVRHAR